MRNAISLLQLEFLFFFRNERKKQPTTKQKDEKSFGWTEEGIEIEIEGGFLSQDVSIAFYKKKFFPNDQIAKYLKKKNNVYTLPDRPLFGTKPAAISKMYLLHMFDVQIIDVHRMSHQ